MNHNIWTTTTTSKCQWLVFVALEWWALPDCEWGEKNVFLLFFFFFKQGNKQFFWTLAVLPVQLCGFVGSVRRRWVTKGCWWIFYVLIDHRYVWAGTIWTTCCAGFEVCPSVMITYEHISRPRRLITISRTPADHTPFEYSVFLSWLYVAWASCYRTHGSPLCLDHMSPTRHGWNVMETLFKRVSESQGTFTFCQLSCVMVPLLHFTENEWHNLTTRPLWLCMV